MPFSAPQTCAVLRAPFRPMLRVLSPREWALIFGGIMTGTVIFIPRFTHFRILNIVAIIGTGSTAIYLIADSVGRGFDFNHYNK